MTTLKTIFSMLAALFICPVNFAGDPDLPPDTRNFNGIYFNYLGEASMVSLDYERLFFIKSSVFITCRLGIGYNEEFELFDIDDNGAEKHMSVPLIVTGDFGWKRNFFEAGFGSTFFAGKTSHLYLYPVIGYRLLPLKKKRAYFRIFAGLPLYDNEDTDIWFFPLGAGVGFAF